MKYVRIFADMKVYKDEMRKINVNWFRCHTIKSNTSIFLYFDVSALNAMQTINF